MACSRVNCTVIFTTPQPRKPHVHPKAKITISSVAVFSHWTHVLPSGRVKFAVTLIKTEIRNNLSAFVSVLRLLFFHRISAMTRAAHDVSVTSGKHRCTYREKEYFPGGVLWVYPKCKTTVRSSKMATLVYIDNWQVCNEMTALTILKVIHCVCILNFTFSCLV